MHHDTKDTVVGAGVMAAGCLIHTLWSAAILAVAFWLFSLMAG